MGVEEESMPVYDIDIKDVIEEEEGFVEKRGFGREEDNIEDILVVVNDICSSIIQTTLSVDFSKTIDSNPHELIWLQKGNLVEVSILIGKKYQEEYLKDVPMVDKYGFKTIKVRGSDVAKKPGKEKKTKKRRKLGSSSISINLKVNEMLYKSLNEQQKKSIAEEASDKARKEAEDEAKRKAKEASEQERKEAKDEAKRKEEEASENARKQAEYEAKRKANEEAAAKAKAEEEAIKKAVEEAVIKKADELEAKATEEQAMKKAIEEEPLKQATEEPAIKKATKKGIKAEAKKKASKGKNIEETEDSGENADETADVNQTDNEEDVKETDDVEQILKKIPTMPFLNTSTRSKKKEADKGLTKTIAESLLDLQKEAKQKKKEQQLEKKRKIIAM
ncbi:hypothetical protein Tco_0539754, partial [Tanacetum coccineum]